MVTLADTKAGDPIVVISSHGRKILTRVSEVTNSYIVVEGTKFHKISGRQVQGKRPYLQTIVPYVPIQR